MALALLLLAGCERDAAPAPDVDTAVIATPAEGDADDALPGEVDAIRVVDRAPVAGAGGDFDVRAFAGTFEAADGVRLDLVPDGTYSLAAGAGEVTGTWSVESDGTRIRLDPDSKEEDDRVLTLVSSDELSSEGDGQVLRRAGD